jgi:hypothetical protein
MCQVSGLIDGSECCVKDEDKQPGDDCSPTVECEIVGEACDDVIDAVNHIRELVAEADASSEEPTDIDPLADACNSLTVAVGELVREAIDYAQPDAGMEPF